MVIDCFYYNGEEETLKLRLEILNDVVDRFIVIEADTTFSGKQKELTYKGNNPKVTYIVVENEMEDVDLYTQAILSPNTGEGEDYWVREWVQKESLKYALEGLDDEDIVFISDCDEIWNPNIKIEGDLIYKPKQLPYMYFINQRTDEDWLGWSGTIATKYKNIKNACINHLRTDSMTDYEVIENGGWHFNSLGGREKKQTAFAHPIYENEVEWKRREVNMRKDDTDLPVINKEKWKHLLLA